MHILGINLYGVCAAHVAHLEKQPLIYIYIYISRELTYVQANMPTRIRSIYSHIHKRARVRACLCACVDPGS
jgi:hypothetical protein